MCPENGPTRSCIIETSIFHFVCTSGSKEREDQYRRLVASFAPDFRGVLVYATRDPPERRAFRTGPLRRHHSFTRTGGTDDGVPRERDPYACSANSEWPGCARSVRPRRFFHSRDCGVPTMISILINRRMHTCIHAYIHDYTCARGERTD